MGNIVSYLQSQQKSFSELPFNVIDSLVLSSASYLDFESIEFADVHSTNQVKLHDILALGDPAALTQERRKADYSNLGKMGPSQKCPESREMYGFGPFSRAKQPKIIH